MLGSTMFRYNYGLWARRLLKLEAVLLNILYKTGEVQGTVDNAETLQQISSVAHYNTYIYGSSPVPVSTVV